MSALPPISNTYAPTATTSFILETDEKNQITYETSKPLFDMEALCTQILYSLPPTEAASTIIATTPEILLSLCHFSQKELIDDFNKQIGKYSKNDQKNILKTLDILYSSSLRNSKYNGTTQTLENEIQNHIERSKPENFKNLIQNASALFNKGIKKNQLGLQKQLAAVREMMGKISEVIDIYYLIDPTFQERVKKLYTDTLGDFGVPTFPNCQKYYGKLCQNLEVNKAERLELLQLRTLLNAKTNLIHQKLTKLYAPSSLPQPRESLIRDNPVLFWQAGAQFLNTAFKTTFQERPVYLPKEFTKAVKDASKLDPDYRQYSCSKLSKGLGNPPERFIDHVWIAFLEDPNINDVDDFMRRILQRVPEEAFQKLQANFGKQLLLDTLNEYFKTQITGNLTFMSLKSWCRNS